MGYRWDFYALTIHPTIWLWGFLVTLGYSVATIAGGLLIGVVCGVLMLSGYRLITWPVSAFVQVFRCTPLLVQIIWFYYALPVVIDLSIPAWLAAGLGLTAYMSAFSAEIFRGGIISIDKGQWQAARALGMTNAELMRHIILPQAIKRMVPPFVNQSVLQLKNTSLLAVVAVPDMMYNAQVLVSETFRPLEIYTGLGVAYFIILAPMQMLAKRLEHRDDI